MLINQLKTVLFLGLLTGLLLWFGSLWGQSGFIFSLIVVFIMNFGTYFFSDKIVLSMYGAKPVANSHWLHQLVKEVAQKAGLPMPKVYIINQPTPNAFATGRNPNHAAVACTEGILQILSKEELRGVLAHELSHIKNRDTLIATVAATIAGVITFSARMAGFGFGRSDDRNGNILGFLFLIIVTPIVATMIQLAISRSREYLADATGASIIKDPKALATALQKISNGISKVPMQGGSQATASLFIANPFKGSTMLNLFSTHPPMEERVRRLNQMNV